MAPGGARAYVLSTQWDVHGGGVYEVSIGCDGTLRDEGKVLGAKMPFAMKWAPASTPGQRVLMASQDVLGSRPDELAHLIDLATVERITSASVFPDDGAYVGSLALTPGGKLALLGDTSSFNSVPDRIGVVAIEGDSLRKVQVVENVKDPVAIEVSPFGTTALVVSGFGDAIFVLDIDTKNLAAPVSLRGKLQYVGDGPKVPGDAVQVERGKLRGLVLLSDYTGVRRVRFIDSAPGIEDLGRFDLGSGTESLAGAIGVQP
jgi:hypothetical protein